jgi:hypothetical protein
MFAIVAHEDRQPWQVERMRTQPKTAARIGQGTRREVRPGASTDPKHWRERAEEMRAMAEEMTEVETRAIMLRLADVTTSSPTERKTALAASNRKSTRPPQLAASSFFRNRFRCRFT